MSSRVEWLRDTETVCVAAMKMAKVRGFTCYEIN